MPTKGYKTITIRSAVFDKLVNVYEKKKRDLIMEDIKSYSAYAQKLLEFALDQDTLEGRFRMLSLDGNLIEMRDYFRQKDTRVEIMEKRKLYCRLDETDSCEHVGYVLANPSVVKRAKELGVKLRKT